ncbi:p26 [Peridroma alphabaculovirus]|uniref:p26 n=1 Tax=Peridroma alphabaculovirus TaxID=1346829 RepID=A0A068LKM5_9ABAC|nr:p26 [Peridroma alphabaculovirus]AIE47854.1 p26 [Peridroma alphabaculovirus]
MLRCFLSNRVCAPTRDERGIIYYIKMSRVDVARARLQIRAMYKMAYLATVLALVAAMAVSANTLSKHNVTYTVDEVRRTMRVNTVDGVPVTIEPIPPHSDTDGRDELSVLHQFPGVATQVVFPPLAPTDTLFVQLNNKALYRTRAAAVYTNFHTHKGRMVYGQLLTIVVDDLAVAGKIYVGAPIFRDRKLVSVVTCRMDDYDKGVALFPVTGIRPRGLVSGQFNFDDRVIVQELRPGMSVYGRQQLPYDSAHMSVKHFALATVANKQAYRDMPRAIAVFHNQREVTVALVEGEFEVDRVRFDGPLIVPQE